MTSSLACVFLYYYSHTKPIATYGGEYTEGIVGQPLHINPIISPSNGTDEDLVQLIYSGLFKYNNQGKLVNDLVKSYTLTDNNTIYTIHLKKNVLWQDNKPFKADDVLFTLNLISDPAYKSPLRTNWQGVKTTVIDDFTIQFKTDAPYVGFLNNLTFGILPKHIWESITPINFSLNSLNLEPIGTGPYKFNSIQKDKKGNIISYSLDANPTYFAGKPYINKITLKFYTDEKTAIKALNKKEVMGINAISPQNDKLINKKNILLHKIELPRYFAVFLNQTKSIPIASDAVRQALAYATNRQEIINQVLDGNGQPIFSPFLPNMIGYTDKLNYPKFDLAKANKILNDNGWKKGSDGFRGKDGLGLSLNLITINWPELIKTANLLKTQWGKVGVKVKVKTYSLSDVQQNYIRPREYEALLFGQIVGNEPDPYSFWYSSQKKDPGLNLSLFGDADSDKLISDGRVQFDNQKRAQDYIAFQKILLKENPAIFLYTPKYIYPLSKKLQGVDIKNIIASSDRFANINKWYLKTRRVKK